MWSRTSCIGKRNHTGNGIVMNFAVTVSGVLSSIYAVLGSLVGSVVEIEDSAVPETAAAHCNVHWSILCIIAVYGIYAVLRAGYIKRAFLSEEDPSDGAGTLIKKGRRYINFDTIIGIITLALLCLSKFYWTCSVDYKVATAGSIIIIICTIIIEILNYRLYTRQVG